jgi:hypothetical protein
MVIKRNGMNATAEITLHVKSIEQILLRHNSPYYCKRMLNEDVEEYIIEEASVFRHHKKIILKIYLIGSEIACANEIVSAVHKHFEYRKNKSLKQLKEGIQRGWRSLLIGFLFLGIIFLLSEIVKQLLPDSPIIMTVRESLIIIGWVALWRPAELLLYEWRPFKREVNLFLKLEHSNVQIISEDKNVPV